jgi:ABC-type uncharacterized transport system ATPase subunit
VIAHDEFATTIKIMLGMTRATSGDVRVLGSSPANADAVVVARSQIGFVSEERDLYDHLSVGDMLRFTARFYPRWRAELQEKYPRPFALSREQRIDGFRAEKEPALVSALCRGADRSSSMSPRRASIPRRPTTSLARL